MKKKSFLVLLFSSIFFISCSNGPKDAAKNFTENLAKGKVDEAKKYATESTGKFIDFASGFGLPVDPNFKFESEKDSIVDNRAWVTYIDQSGEEEKLELVRIDGKWLVHIESKK